MKMIAVLTVLLGMMLGVLAHAGDLEPKITYINDGEKLSIKERKKLKANEKYMARDLKRVNKNCGKVIPVMFDKKFVKPFMAANRSLTMCTTFAEGIGNLCKDDDIKADVLKAVTAVKCVYGKTGKDIQFKMEGKTFVATFGPNISNSSKKTREWLENNL